MKQEVFEIRDHLVKNNYPNGLIAMLDDYFTNKTISREEIEEMMEQENFAELVDNYQLRGIQRELTFREANSIDTTSNSNTPEYFPMASFRHVSAS